ncbi:MAG: carboxypeptidase M32 [Rickettsiaceae bacterium H1]|nr:carboxypeptidase M32 [Rickettsiaceae bacterium H1]
MRLYESLCNIFGEINNIDNTISLLKWDGQVNMPKGSYQNRINQINTLSSIKHDILTNNTLTNLIQENNKQRVQLNNWQKSNLTQMERINNNARIIPIDLLKSFNQACISSEEAWKKAKEENKFKHWLPKLQEVVNLARKIATIKSEFFNCSKYEALLDNYEPNLSIENINLVFTEIGKFLRKFINAVAEKQPKINKNDNDKFSIEKQREISKEIIKLMKLPINHIRIDESMHPFTIGNQFDTRITTSYNEQDFTKGFKATLHECGHAIYNLNLPREFHNQPVGQATFMGMHEAQALLFEKQIGSSFEFIRYIVPILKKVLKGKNWSVKNVYNIINQVSLSPIRIYADELTYPAHIMIRYTIEKALIEDELQAKDLPQAWAEDMKHYLGVTPKSDAEGCMQDIHWASGLFGYFPSYLLGTVIAAQLFAKIKEQIPNVMKQISEGNLEEIIKWLTNNIYKHGGKYKMQEIMQLSVGQELNSQHYIYYLRDKYCNNHEDNE